MARVAQDAYQRWGETIRRVGVRLDQVGDGYGARTDAAVAALRDAARTEGLLLDPVYTGKALAGLRAAVADGSVRPGERTVFVHTRPYVIRGPGHVVVGRFGGHFRAGGSPHIARGPRR